MICLGKILVLITVLLLTACKNPEQNTCTPDAAQAGECNPFQTTSEPHIDE